MLTARIGRFRRFSSVLSLPLAALFWLSAATFGQTTPLTWGDQGNGTYKNPVLKSDYSDPDVIRVGRDFYLVGSDFNYVGIQVLHSYDLVNWQIIGQVFDKLAMDPKYDQMKGYGEGTWAPSLRYHNGEFYLYVCTPHEGLFMWHTKNPAGPWSEMVTVKKVDLWEDPCPFWDDDGQAYLVHSHKGAGPLILHKMSADGTQLLDDGKLIYQGPNSEGPKFYKRHGFYYNSLPEGGVGTGGQTVLRSKDIYGPYERRQVLPNGAPHQGGMVELDNGQAWFISFKQTGYLGRIPYLNPVKWGDDDWPVFGDNGMPVDSWVKPDVGQVFPVSHPATSDEFDSPVLSPIWQWNHNPVAAGWSLSEHPGYLRLKALPADSMATARNTLTEKLWDSAGVIDVKLDVSAFADGQRAGFTFITGNKFGWVGVSQDNGVRRIAWDNDGGAGPVVTAGDVYLRGVYEGKTARLQYSMDGKNFTGVGQPFTLGYLFWKGARPGIFCHGPSGGSADFDYVHYRYAATPADLGLTSAP